MSVAAIKSLKLSSSDKETLAEILKEFQKIRWEKGEYVFHNFIDYYQLPQIIRVKQTWKSDLTENQWLYLKTLFDRYLIIAVPLTTKSKLSRERYLIPDWFQGECRILSKNPRLKQRWWVFQGAFELYRFELPRSIKILSHTPAHRRAANSASEEWEKIILCKNSHLNVVRRQQYQSRMTNHQGEATISEPKEAFVLQDPISQDEFIMPPGVPLRFATLIEPTELHAQYQNHDGTFTFPEIMMRYEFPVDIEILTHLPIDLVDFKAQVRLEKFCVAKSVLAFIIDSKHAKMIELSPMTEFSLNCAKCLTYGLPDESEKQKDEKFDEKEYQRYEDLRSRLGRLFDEMTEIQRSKIQIGTSDEIECIEAAYDISMKMKAEDGKPNPIVHLPLDEMFKVLKDEGKRTIQFSKQQPKRFTVHASADPSNPYNEVIDFEDMDALTINNDGSTKNSSSGKRPALVVQQLPPPMMLPPESFAKTVKAIPEKLYTDFLPATPSKKSTPNEEQSPTPSAS